MSDDKFIGWVCRDKDAVNGQMVWEEYTPKEWREDDIEGEVLACGMCWSDISTMSDGWGKAMRPLVTGHEIVIKVTKVGKDVTQFKVGDRAGIGAQGDSCRECHCCKNDWTPYCMDGIVGTYNGKFKNGSGNSFGGYAKRWRGRSHFAVPIPDNLESYVAGPLMCGGITIYSPLKNYGCGKEGVKRVGIVGIGGIGAFGVAFAKAMGAEEVVAIGHSPSKKEMAHNLGATDFVATGEGDKNPLLAKYKKSLDLIVVTTNVPTQRYDWYLQALRPMGHVVNIAIPEEATMPIPIGAMISNGANMGGSCVGGPKQIAEMLKFAGDHKPTFMIEKRKMSDANQAVQDLVAGKPRFRYSLIPDEVWE